MRNKTIGLAIRDDDTNYFTHPEDLEFCYSKIWDICPVSLSVVPFHACTKSGAVPKEHWSGSEIFALQKNRELVAFLRESISRGRTHIMLHGYHHRDELKGYEFEAGVDLERKVNEGKSYLENLLGQEVKIFVPPHNTLSPSGYRAVLKAGMHISGIQPFKPSFRGWNPKVIALGIKRRVVRKLSGDIDPWPITFPDGHRELPFHGLTPGVALCELTNRFNKILQTGGIFCLATHYWEFNHPMKDGSGIMREALDMFWKYIKRFSENIRFMTLSDLVSVDPNDTKKRKNYDFVTL